MSTLGSPRCRVALVGVSSYARIHLDLALAAQARGEIELGAVVIINPEAEEVIEVKLRAQGCQIYRDYESMLAAESGRIALCLIPTGIQWHTRITIAALRAGANVLVEKPLASSLAEVSLIAATESETGRWVAVGFQDIYCPVNRRLKSELLAGKIGRLQRVKFLGIWPRSQAYFQRNNWAGRLNVDGVPVLDSPLNNAFAHFVNLCLYLAGKELESSAGVEVHDADLWRTNNIESFDSCVVRASSTDGVRFWFGASHSCLPESPPILIIEGTEGRVEWIHEQSYTLFRNGGLEETHPLPTAVKNRQTMFGTVIARLQNPTLPICSTAIARCHTSLIEGVHSSCEIQVVPAALVASSASLDGDSHVLVVNDLYTSMRRAFVTMELLRDSASRSNSVDGNLAARHG